MPSLEEQSVNGPVNPERLILVGGWHESIELCEDARIELVGIIDPCGKSEMWGVKVLGDDKTAAENFSQWSDIPVLVYPGPLPIRRKLFAYYQELGYQLASVIHPSAHVSRSAVLGRGVVLSIGVNISAHARIGDSVAVGVNANIMHDSTVGSFSALAPDAVVLGQITIGEEVYVGSNCTILPSLKVGDGAVIGAGAVVTKDVAAGSVVAGNPARVMERR